MKSESEGPSLTAMEHFTQQNQARRRKRAQNGVKYERAIAGFGQKSLLPRLRSPPPEGRNRSRQRFLLM